MLRTFLNVSAISQPDLVVRLRDLAQIIARLQFSPNAELRAGIATQELVDNAIRYGSVRAEIGYELAYDDENGFMIVKVANTALPSRLALLKAHMEGLMRSPEAGSVEVHKAAGTTWGGLARIRSEALMDISTELAEDRLAVIATACV